MYKNADHFSHNNASCTSSSYLSGDTCVILYQLGQITWKTINKEGKKQLAGWIKITLSQNLPGVWLQINLTDCRTRTDTDTHTQHPAVLALLMLCVCVCVCSGCVAVWFVYPCHRLQVYLHSNSVCVYRLHHFCVCVRARVSYSRRSLWRPLWAAGRRRCVWSVWTEGAPASSCSPSPRQSCSQSKHTSNKSKQQLHRNWE